jgi:hypothetical protein
LANIFVFIFMVLPFVQGRYWQSIQSPPSPPKISVPRFKSFGSPFFGQPAFVFVAPVKTSGLLELTIDRNRLKLTRVM